MSRIVASLGETAFVDDKMAPNESVRTVAEALEPLVCAGHQLIVCHGDAKLEGMVNLVFELGARNKTTPSMPFPECAAMSEGYMGFHLTQELDNLLMKKDPHRTPTVAVLTQTIVENAAGDGTLGVGAAVDEKTADRLMSETGDEYARVSEGKWRRRYPAARPIGFREEKVLKDLLKNHPVIVCAGGGGVPVERGDAGYSPASCIVEIDEAAEVLAEKLDADMLLLLSASAPPKEEILTPSQARDLAKDSPDQAIRLECAATFADSGSGRHAILASFSQARDAAAGGAGLRVG